MLLSFSVADFRSFANEQTLNMVASKQFADHPAHLHPIGTSGESAVRAALLYGANAAGKSNLVSAMKFAQRLIRRQGEHRLRMEPFLFQPADAAKPTSVEFRFYAGGRVYTYGFDLKPNHVAEEWLFAGAGADESVIYHRTEQRVELGEDLTDELGSSEAAEVMEAVRLLGAKKSQLFLSKIVDLDPGIRGISLSAVVDWFTKTLTIIEPDTAYRPLLEELDTDADFRRFSAAYLQHAGTGINDVVIATKILDSNQLDEGLAKFVAESAVPIVSPSGHDLALDPSADGRVRQRSLETIRSLNGIDYRLAFAEESDGTQRLQHLLPAVYQAFRGPKVLVIDELDRSLHPLLAWKYMEYFLQSCPEQESQLVATTHETHLLNQELLRRDEVWFVEKDADQRSHLFPLTDFSVRNDLRLDKGYINGRFGAIPYFGPFLFDYLHPTDGQGHAPETEKAVSS